MKYLLVLLVVGFGLWMLLARLRGDRGDQGDEPKRKAGRASPPAAKSLAPLEMVECAHCHLHLPAADALQEGARVYCSDAHRRLGPAPAPPAP